MVATDFIDAAHKLGIQWNVDLIDNIWDRFLQIYKTDLTEKIQANITIQFVGFI
jgi:hypothetical protein